MSKQQNMFALIRQWERTGLPKSEFARQKGIHLQTFHYWCRRYRQDQAERLPATFIELPSVESTPTGSAEIASNTPRLSLEFPDGLRLTIY